jgi:hypothetical protein
MNLAELQRKLLAAARADRPSDRVPLAFEKRILARLPLRPALNRGADWARAFWRALAPCAAIMVLFGAWSLLAPTTNTNGGSGSNDLAQEFENTVFAAVDQDQVTADNFW